MKTTATFTFTSEGAFSLGKLVGELLDTADYELVKFRETNNNPFYVEYSFVEEIDEETVGIGSGAIDSEEESEFK